MEVFHERGREVLPEWSREGSSLVRGDHLQAEVTWQGHEGIRELKGTPVRFRFHLRNAQLYSLWVDD